MLITNDSDLAVKARKFAGMGFKNLSSKKSDLVAGVPLEYQTPTYERNDELGLNYRFNEFLGKIPMPKHWHKNYFSEDSKKTTEKQVEKRWIKK